MQLDYGRRSPAVLLLVVLTLSGMCLPLWAQFVAAPQADNTGKASSYEIVSIKPHRAAASGSIWGWRTADDGFSASGIALENLIMNAYDLTMPTQISGLPGWANSEPYDIETKVDAETAEAWKKLTYKERWKLEQPMVQSLLADRCQMKVHREMRELPVYDLVIAKGGLKMKVAAADEVDSEMVSGVKMTAHGFPANSLVPVFSGMVGRMIVDKTGLGDKKFDFELTWTPDDRRAAENAADAGPSIFTALEEQLGLKLVPAKSPVEVIVIDHIEKPSPN